MREERRKAVCITPIQALCTEPQGLARTEEEERDTPACQALSWASVTPRGGVRGPGILPEWPSTLTATKEI